jgi:hypothetical protein
MGRGRFRTVICKLLFSPRVNTCQLHCVDYTHMSLRDFQDTAYTGNVDNTRCVTFDIPTTLVKQAQKSSCHVIHGESIDLVERGPRIHAIVVEKCAS